jgi:hypothetical protein
LTDVAQPALLPLLATVGGIDRLVPLDDGAPGVPYDVDLEIMELAHAFRVTPDTLRASAVPGDAGGGSGAEAGWIGGRARRMVWSCGDWNRRAAVHPVRGRLLPLFDLRDVVIHVLQRRPGSSRLARRRSASTTVADDVTDAARRGRCARSTSYVTVDTMMAHLAGALACRCGRCSPSPADWPLDGRSRHQPVVSTMRLVRQPRPGDWPAVIARVRDDLAALARQPAGRARRRARPPAARP